MANIRTKCHNNLRLAFKKSRLRLNNTNQKM